MSEKMVCKWSRKSVDEYELCCIPKEHREVLEAILDAKGIDCGSWDGIPLCGWPAAEGCQYMELIPGPMAALEAAAAKKAEGVNKMDEEIEGIISPLEDQSGFSWQTTCGKSPVVMKIDDPRIGYNTHTTGITGTGRYSTESEAQEALKKYCDWCQCKNLDAHDGGLGEPIEGCWVYSAAKKAEE